MSKTLTTRRVARRAANVPSVVLDRAAMRHRCPPSAADHELHRPLVTLHVGPARNAPVIFAPGAGGNVASGLNLAQSLRDRVTVYGLQPRGLNNNDEPYSTVQAAVTAYQRAIREVQPRGPYRLAGHSFGGWLVFELACRLAAEGEEVAPIVLIDSAAPTSANIAVKHHGRVDVLMKLINALEAFHERRADLVRDELTGLGNESQLSRVAQAMKALGALPRTGDADDIRGLVRVFEANVNTRYVPALRFPGCAVLFQAAERWCGVDDEEEDADAASEAWRDHVGRLERVFVPGNHLTMLKKPHVERLAGHLSKLWRELPRNRATTLVIATDDAFELEGESP